MAALALAGSDLRAGSPATPLEPFEAPGPDERAAAIGPLGDAIDAAWRALLVPHVDDFSPISVPGPDDWLARRVEFGQTFREFAASSRPVPGLRRRTLVVLPLGLGAAEDPVREDDELVDRLAAFLRLFHGLPVRCGEAWSLDGFRDAARIGPDGRFQLDVEWVLDRLESVVPEDAFAVVGITGEDLRPAAADGDYLFGQARGRRRVAVCSLARLGGAGDSGSDAEAASRLRLERAAKLLAHETGHLLGMSHCIHFACVMNGSNHLGEADARPLHLCPVCLRKEGLATGCDPVRRYRGLAGFYRKHGLHDPAEWAERRLRRAGE